MAGEGVVILPLALASATLIGGDPTKLTLEVRNDITGLGRYQVRKCLPLKLRTSEFQNPLRKPGC